MRLGCQNSPFAEMDPLKGMLELISWPIEAIEFVADKPWSMPQKINKASRIRIREIVKDAGLRLTVHSPFKGQDLTSPFPWKARRSMENAEAAIDLAYDLGAAGVIIHPGSGRMVPRPLFMDRVSFCGKFMNLLRKSSPPRPGNTERNVGVLGQLLQMSKKRQIELYLENPPSLRNGSGIFKQSLSAHTDLNICYDYGHSLLSDWDWLLNDHFDRLAYVHYHLNDGETDDHNPISADNIEARKFLRLLFERGFDGTIMIEPKVGDLEGARTSVESTTKMLEEITSYRKGKKANEWG